MCEQFSLQVDLDDLVGAFRIDRVTGTYAPRVSIAPTDVAPVIVAEGDGRRLEAYRWGLYPFWAADSVTSEWSSISGKRAFRRIWGKQRCVIPCSGFYGRERTVKNPRSLRFSLKDRPIFGVAGVYDTWRHPNGEWLCTFTMMTTAPNPLTVEYVDSMPAILSEAHMNEWLHSQESNPYKLASLIEPADERTMEAYPIHGHS